MCLSGKDECTTGSDGSGSAHEYGDQKREVKVCLYHGLGLNRAGGGREMEMDRELENDVGFSVRGGLRSIWKAPGCNASAARLKGVKKSESDPGLTAPQNGTKQRSAMFTRCYRDALNEGERD